MFSATIGFVSAAAAARLGAAASSRGAVCVVVSVPGWEPLVDVWGTLTVAVPGSVSTDNGRTTVRVEAACSTVADEPEEVGLSRVDAGAVAVSDDVVDRPDWDASAAGASDIARALLGAAVIVAARRRDVVSD
jgi:hypothetical protein